jgi:hypothetical protein
MKNFHFDTTETQSLSEVLNYLETEAEYAETIRENPEFAEGMTYTLDHIRAWLNEKNVETFVDVDFTKRNREFLGNRK